MPDGGSATWLQGLLSWVLDSDGRFFVAATLVLGLISAAGLVLKPGAWIADEKEKLKTDPSYRAAALLEVSDQRWYSSYRDRLEGVLRRLDAWQGPLGGPFSLWPQAPWRGFVWCLVVAYVYTVLALLITVMSGGNISFRSDTSTVAPLAARLLLAASLVVCGGVIVVCTRWSERIDGAVAAWWEGRRGAWPASLLSNALSLVVSMLAFAAIYRATLSLLPALTVAMIFAWTTRAGPAAMAAQAAMLGLLGVIVTITGAVTAILPIVGALCVLLTGAGRWVIGTLILAGVLFSLLSVMAKAQGLAFAPVNEYLAGITVVFWFAFPVLNAATDFISWIVSRALARNLLPIVKKPEDHSFAVVVRLMLHLVLDLVVALALFFFTAWCVLQGFTLWNAYLAWLGLEERLAPDMRAIVQAPLSDGLWFWLMITTTLLPTLLHIGLVLASPTILMRSLSTGLQKEIDQKVLDRAALRRAKDDDRTVAPEVPELSDAGYGRLAQFRAVARPACLVSCTLLAFSLAGAGAMAWNASRIVHSIPWVVVWLGFGSAQASLIAPDEPPPSMLDVWRHGPWPELSAGPASMREVTMPRTDSSSTFATQPTLGASTVALASRAGP